MDLNRNFPAGWHGRGVPWDPEHPGPRPLSEPETRLARRLVLRVQPMVTIWLHEPQALVRVWGRSMPEARRYARLAGMSFRAIRWPAGTAPRWQNPALRAISFVVELPPGRLSARQARRYARAVLALAAGSSCSSSSSTERKCTRPCRRSSVVASPRSQAIAISRADR